LAKLVEDGVSAQQIAMLLKLDDAEAVFAECDKAGIPRPPMNYDITAESAEPGVAISDEDKAEIDAILDEAGRPMTLEQAIVTCYLEGKNVAQITSQLTRNDQPLTRKKVTAVLRRYRQDPEAFGQIPAPVSVAAAEEEEFDGINPFEDDGE
jgi:hypothetical protein